MKKSSLSSSLFRKRGSYLHARYSNLSSSRASTKNRRKAFGMPLPQIMATVGLRYLVALVGVAILTSSPSNSKEQLPKRGTEDNPIISIEYSADELRTGVIDRIELGRGRTIKYEMSFNEQKVEMINRHRTRGWHLCFSTIAYDAEGKVVGQTLAKRALREKGVRNSDVERATLRQEFPSSTDTIVINGWRCSEGDFWKETADIAVGVAGALLTFYGFAAGIPSVTPTIY